MLRQKKRLKIPFEDLHEILFLVTIILTLIPFEDLLEMLGNEPWCQLVNVPQGTSVMRNVVEIFRKREAIRRGGEVMKSGLG